jgi:hypothetical protein
LFDGGFAIDRVIGQTAIPDTQIPISSAQSILSGDYCAGGITLEFEANNLRTNPGQNSQDFHILLDLQDDVAELFEDGQLSIQRWTIKFENDRVSGVEHSNE